MAQNIAIQEGNQGKQFGHINKLKISNQGGGTSLWVPEDEVRTKSLYVSENGTYLASKDEVYGYDEVTVNITKEVAGLKYDEDTGELDGYYDIEVDDDDFFIEDDEGEIGEELPTSIKITKEPDKVKFKDGSNINIKGIEVTAYYENGEEWGIVPFEELDFSPKKAKYGDEGEVVVGGLVSPVYLTKIYDGEKFAHYKVGDDEYYYYIYDYSATAPVYCYNTKDEDNHYTAVFVSTEPFSFKTRRTRPYGWDAHVAIHNSGRHMYQGEVAYTQGNSYASANTNLYADLSPTSATQFVSPEDAATLAITTGTFLGDKQEITVIWDDGMGVIEPPTDTYFITVVAANIEDGEGGNGGGGSGGGSW